MDKIAIIVSGWHLHPVVDHFTIALLFVALIADLAASLLPARLWLRYAALALIIMGAIAAAGSWFTGGIDGHRTAKLLSPAARAVLHTHAQVGDYLMITFAVLALWRLLIQLLTFMNRTRQIFLAAMVLAVGALSYQGYLGGKLVYDYGAGTALLLQGTPAATTAGMAPAPTVAPAQSAVPSSLPTVYVPTTAPTVAPGAEPTVSKMPAPPMEAPASAVPSAAATH